MRDKPGDCVIGPIGAGSSPVTNCSSGYREKYFEFSPRRVKSILAEGAPISRRVPVLAPVGGTTTTVPPVISPIKGLRGTGTLRPG